MSHRLSVCSIIHISRTAKGDVGSSIGEFDMSLLAMLLFVGTMALSLWATMRVRQVYGKFSQLPASSGSSGAETAATILVIHKLKEKYN